MEIITFTPQGPANTASAVVSVVQCQSKSQIDAKSKYRLNTLDLNPDLDLRPQDQVAGAMPHWMLANPSLKKVVDTLVTGKRALAQADGNNDPSDDASLSNDVIADMGLARMAEPASLFGAAKFAVLVTWRSLKMTAWVQLRLGMLSGRRSVA
jgi:hypothetical protein